MIPAVNVHKKLSRPATVNVDTGRTRVLLPTRVATHFRCQLRLCCTVSLRKPVWTLSALIQSGVLHKQRDLLIVTAVPQLS
ncbi:uncharacterized protein EI90DRAFT_3076641 [Cantharellus anzutake]|uniref:uncharacterized protein n=1 Tax=Cantharellus anzutake TaxID=1750568 RepID=UPI001903B3F4|nr:uncharacterized protein EI90DRAFT_3076641 [Cantharellus anzutake]KAF8323632.1 hypothetical protein EI90DRAFT_3076641 [Cantharellus anzutake]